MPTDFKLPELGENIASGDVVSVSVKEGDTVRAGQGVIEVETDKAVIEVPCNVAGRVTKVHVQPGHTIAVGAPVLTLEAGSTAAVPAPAAKPAAPPPLAPKAATPPPAPAKPAAATPPPRPSAPTPPPLPPSRQQPAAPVAADDDDDVAVVGNGTYDAVAHPASPAVRRLARELGVDLASVDGTGGGGRITADDVKNAVRQATSGNPRSAATPAARIAPTANNDNWGSVRRETMPKIRKTIAANMVISATTIPHVTNFDDADVTELEKMRKLSAPQYAESGVKLTMLAFVAKAVAYALKQHPTLNASIDLDAGEIIYKEYVNVGLAVDAPRGLMVPVMRNTDRLSIPAIAQQIAQLADKAKNNQITVDDMRGGTFTISNLGAVGGGYSTPIINSPEVAILLVGRAKKKAVVVGDDDRIVPRLMLPLSLSYDHRLVDGAAAARFLNEVINLLEVPGRLLLAP